MPEAHVHEFRPVIDRVGGFEFVRGYRCACGETKALWGPPGVSRAEAIAAGLRYMQARYGRTEAGKWAPHGWNPWRALNTVADYEECALGAHAAVRHVRVRAAANDERMPAGEVEVRVRGRWRRRLPDDVVRVVHRELAMHNPVGVALTVKS
jgi:hypothetical protein